MEKSESIKNLAAGLAKFHSVMGKVVKSANNPFFKSKYAPLPDILEAIAEPLQEAGLTFSQIPSGDTLCTILVHVESGEWLQGCYAMHPVKSDPQSIGSAITYARRYALGAILGLNIDEDDDGNQSSGKAPQKPVQQPQQPERKTITDEAFKRLCDRITAGEYDAFDKAMQTLALSPQQERHLKTLLPK